MTQPGAIFRDGHMVEQTVDHGDGTGTRTVYDETGAVVSTEQVEMPLPDPRDLTRDELLAKVDALSGELAAVKTELKSGVAAMNAIIDMPRANFTTVAGAVSTVNYLGDRVRELATVLRRTMEVVYAGQSRTVAGFRIMVDQLDDPVDDDDVNAARAKAADQPVTKP